MPARTASQERRLTGFNMPILPYEDRVTRIENREATRYLAPRCRAIDVFKVSECPSVRSVIVGGGVGSSSASVFAHRLSGSMIPLVRTQNELLARGGIT